MVLPFAYMIFATFVACWMFGLIESIVFATIVACMVVEAILKYAFRLFKRPPTVSFNIPFHSMSPEDTKTYAINVAQLILNLHSQGKRVIIGFKGDRGSGKTAIVTSILQYLSPQTTYNHSSAISFIAVREYTFVEGNRLLIVVHIDPDYKGGHKRLHSMHSKNPDVLLFEHENHNAFEPYQAMINEMGDRIVHLTINISDEEKHRVFTMTSASGVPIETPSFHTWTGHLEDDKISPDIHLTLKQVKKLRRRFGNKWAVILTIETSCDDTCIVVKLGDEIVYEFQKQCEQEAQETGREGIDPLETAKKHALYIEKAMTEIKEELRKRGLTIDLVSVTRGPGQSFALCEGISFAQKMAKEFNAPIMYLDHIMGHAISSRLSPHGKAPQYPYLVFVASGGHTVLLLVESPVNMRIIYTTPDDAIGEVIDKVARELGIPCVPAGPMAERMMNEFFVSKDLWTKITPKTKNSEIDAMNLEAEVQDSLKEFRDVLMALDKCTTPADIKRMLCKLAREQKLRDCNRVELLATYVKNFCTKSFKEHELSGMCNMFSGQWNAEQDGPELIAKLQSGKMNGDFEAVANKCKQFQLLQTLKNIIARNKEKIVDSRAFLMAFLHHFNMIDKVSVEDIAYLCGAFDERHRPHGNATDILEWMKGAELEERYMIMMKPFIIPMLPFSTFIREFYNMTPLSLEQQQFYCACLHSVTLRYLVRHFQEAIAKFPHVKHLSLGGGVACNEFLQENLKYILEKNGRSFFVVPKRFCADNAHMMWMLTVETLKYLFESVEECTCGESDADCQSCENLRDLLLQHECGAMTDMVDKGDILHCADDRWDGSAERKFFKGPVPEPNPILVVSDESVVLAPDAVITPVKMWEFMSTTKKRTTESVWIQVCSVYEQWQDKLNSKNRSWIDENLDTITSMITNEYRRRGIIMLLKTNFFGHGYQAFKDAKPPGMDKKAYDPIVDIDPLFQLINAMTVPTQ